MSRSIFVLIGFIFFCWSIRIFNLTDLFLQNPTISFMSPYGISEKILLELPFSFSEWTAEDWERLPNIGPTLARRIVDFQKLHGSFHSTEQLMDVPGIGPKTFESMKPFLRGAVSPF